ARMLADTAPADVPTMMGNGQSGRGWISASALRTPTWYAARAPPPVRISPARETLAPLLICRSPLRPNPLSRSYPMLALRRILVTALVAVATSVCAQAPDASPAEGTAAPDFKLQDQKGDWHTLSQYKGKWVVLYFYPKDN